MPNLRVTVGTEETICLQMREAMEGFLALYRGDEGEGELEYLCETEDVDVLCYVPGIDAAQQSNPACGSRTANG